MPSLPVINAHTMCCSLTHKDKSRVFDLDEFNVLTFTSLSRVGELTTEDHNFRIGFLSRNLKVNGRKFLRDI